VQTEKFVVRPFVNEETNGSYQFASRLNGLNGLAHLLWLPEDGEHPCLALFIDYAHLAASPLILRYQNENWRADNHALSILMNSRWVS
jgi:hypothetical protein